MSTEKKTFSVFRNEIQKSFFLRRTKTVSFNIFIYNWRRIQNKTNSAQFFVGISKVNKYAKFFAKFFKFNPTITFSGRLYITLENDLIVTSNHAFCLEKTV